MGKQTLGAYKVEVYSFEELAKKRTSLGDQVLGEVGRIAKQRQAKRPGSDEYNVFKDYLSYQDLVYCDYTDFPNFGHVFIARNDDDEAVGFMFCLDDMGVSSSKGGQPVGKSRYPLDLCIRHFDHDLSFLKDLVHLQDFSYVFQIGVVPEVQGKKYASDMLNKFELFYQNEVTLLAASIHEVQTRIISLLQHRNKVYANRHHNVSKRDFQYIFVDHYFSAPSDDSHWFRVVQVLDANKFQRKINSITLPLTYSTVIPIQLNLAAININNIISELDAELIWSSFFNANDLLRKRYGMSNDNHGFFQSVLKQEKMRWNSYDEVRKHLRDITRYLQKKNSPQYGEVSLTDSFKNGSFELFIFDDKEEHKLPSFENPIILSLKESQDSLIKLMHYRIIRRSLVDEESRKISNEQKVAWFNRFLKCMREDTLDTDLMWLEMRKRYLITKEDEQILVKYKKGLLDAKVGKNGERLAQRYRTAKSQINNQQLIKPELRDKWEKYWSLHQTLYNMDRKSMTNLRDYSWCHAVVPINYDGKDMVGIMFTFISRRLKRKDPKYNTRMNDLAELISNALSKHMLNILIKLQQRATQESAYRYAMAAVNSRNMAHNMGSHILPRLDHQAALQRMLEQSGKDGFTAQMAKFLSFLRTRTNLMADMTTSQPASTLSLWLKREVVTHFRQQELIKRFISGTSINKVRINYRYQGNMLGKDVQIQVPNGDLGLSAFSMFLENIIRNSAKYEATQGLKYIEISVDIQTTDDNRRGYFVHIYDHIPRQENHLEDLVAHINATISSDLIISGNELRPYAWGLMEMQAAAAYLRKKIAGETLLEEYLGGRIPFLEAVKQQLPAQSGVKQQWTLGYKIYLEMPRHVIILDDDGQFIRLEGYDLRQRGIMVVPEEQFIKDKQSIYSHDFLIYFHKSTTRKLKANSNKRYPFRSILLDDPVEKQTLFDLLTNSEHEQFLNWIWRFWLKGYTKRKQMNWADTSLRIYQRDEFILAMGNNKGPYLVYDSHELAAKYDELPHKSEILFYQNYLSTDDTGMLINNVKSLSPGELKLLYARLYEATITRVVIIDERIQRNLLELTDNQLIVDAFTTLRKMLVFLPDPHQNPALDLYDSTSSLAAVEDWLEALLTQYRIDFVVLHLGFIESWKNSDMKKISAWIKTHIREHDSRPEIILTSGRGKPHDFPRHVSYQPFSNIARYLTGGKFSKFHLVSTLFSSRTRNSI